MSLPVRCAANCSLLLTEFPLLQRAAAAAAAGFDAVKFWWPFASTAPTDTEVAAFEAGVQLVGLDLFAGDMPAGDRGLASWPGRARELADSVDIAVGLGAALGCTAFNALYGNRLDGVAARRSRTTWPRRTWWRPRGPSPPSAGWCWSRRSSTSTPP